MIFAVEGPDNAGKTTLWTGLRSMQWPQRVHFVEAAPVHPSQMPYIDEIGRRDEDLWRRLYVPGVHYICDRHPFVSNLAYAYRYGREPRVWEVPQLRVIYLEGTPQELAARGDDPVERDWAAAVAAYERALEWRRVLRIRVNLPMAEQEQLAECWIREEMRRGC